MSDPVDFVQERLQRMQADMASQRRELHSMKLQAKEHATWLGKLDQGQALILQMLERMNESLDHIKARLELRDTSA